MSYHIRIYSIQSKNQRIGSQSMFIAQQSLLAESPIDPDEHQKAVESEEQKHWHQSVVDKRPSVPPEIPCHHQVTGDTHGEGLYDPRRQVAQRKEEDNRTEQNWFQTVGLVSDSQSPSVQTE